MKIEGYQICSCGAHVLDQLAWLTDGVCLECFMADKGKYLRDAEIAHQGRTVVAHLSSRVKRGPKKSTKTKHTVEHAKRRAFRRLRSWVPELWDIAYALEREKSGLPPLPIRAPRGQFAATVATISEQGVYHAPDPGDVSGTNQETGATTT